MKKMFLLMAIGASLTACTATTTTEGAAGDEARAPEYKAQKMKTKVASEPDGAAIKVKIKDAFTPCAGNLKGKTDTTLKYGKDDINIKWKSYVGENTEFRIGLKPKHGYESNTVRIIGRWGKKPGGVDTDYSWLNIEGNAKDLADAGKKSVFILCVPAGIPIGTEYKFDVDIDGIGNMDPRTEVTW